MKSEKIIKTILLFSSFSILFILYHFNKINSPEMLAVQIGFLTFIYEIDKARKNSIDDEEKLIKKKLSAFFLELLFEDLCKNIPLKTTLVIEASKQLDQNHLENQLDDLRNVIIGLNPKLSFYNLIGLDKEVKELNSAIIETDEKIVIIKGRMLQLINSEDNMNNKIDELEKSIRVLYEKILKLYI